MSKAAIGQLSFIDALFAPKPPKREEVMAYWRDWLLHVRKVNVDAMPLFDRLLETFERGEAFERSKCLDVLSGVRAVGGWTLEDADALGLFDTRIDYHTCWDRAQAARDGCPKPLVGRIYKNACWRLGHHEFVDSEGKLVWRQGQ